MIRKPRFFSLKEIAGRPGMPATVRGVRLRAERENWPWRKREKSGGGREYQIPASYCLTPDIVKTMTVQATAGYWRRLRRWLARGLRQLARQIDAS